VARTPRVRVAQRQEVISSLRVASVVVRRAVTSEQPLLFLRNPEAVASGPPPRPIAAKGSHPFGAKERWIGGCNFSQLSPFPLALPVKGVPQDAGSPLAREGGVRGPLEPAVCLIPFPLRSARLSPAFSLRPCRGLGHRWSAQGFPLLLQVNDFLPWLISSSRQLPEWLP